MPVNTGDQEEPGAVGKILVKVQEDLLNLRERLLAQVDGKSTDIDISALDSAIQKTELGIKSKTEQVLQQLNNRVLTLPNLEVQRPVEPRPSTEATRAHFANTQTDIRHGVGNDLTRYMPNTSQSDLSRRPVVNLRKPVNRNQIQGPTPGQVIQDNQVERAIINPCHPKNRDVLNDNYGIQLPLIQDRKALKNLQQIVLKGSTIEPLAILPRANRIDPQLLPPQITEQDARRGILNLIERGLIPPAAELTLDPSPVRHAMLCLHEPRQKEPSKPPHIECSKGHLFSGIKLDLEACVREETEPLSTCQQSLAERIPSSITKSHNNISPDHDKTKIVVSPQLLEFQPKPPPTTPASAHHIKDHVYKFVIQNGHVRSNTTEFLAFKQHYCLSWGSIVTMIKYLETLMTNYAIPVAVVNGDKLADLALEFELEQSPTCNDLLSVLIDGKDVENMVHRPGQRFQGPAGKDLAAACIQARWRTYKQRIKYLDIRHLKWAAGVIAISWLMHIKMINLRKQLRNARDEQLEKFRLRARTFAKNWDRIQTSRRTIIHIPSLGYKQSIRESITEFSIFQNMQMGRLCDLNDPNVNVIYISPVPVNDEMMQYYAKLLGLKAAIETGNVENQTDMSTRYKIIVPEAVMSFPTHRMCLATLLKYSPHTMKRIKNLIRGREAYIMTGVPHKDDLHIGEHLNLPFLSPEPEVAQLYSTKSGSKRIFASAEVSVPPGEYDVYSLPQLHECLAQLITENLEVTRWLFKLDDEFDGRGIAYIDVAKHLRCYPWALKEANRYGEKWSKKWAQEAAYIKIHAEIPEVLTNSAQPVNNNAYNNWQSYIVAFLSQGGVIEACPPSDSVTALTVDMFIEPNGRVSVQCLGDQIHADTPFSCWGLSIPQSSVEPEQLNDAAFKVAEACKARGVIGYFAIDFVTFIHPKTMQQMLWAVDLNLSYSDSMSMYRLLQFITKGSLNVKTHYFDIAPPKQDGKKERRHNKEDNDQSASDTNRFAVISTRLQHTNLCIIHYSVFFQMCRAHGIGFDIKEKQGSVFTLIDSFNRENLGMVTVADSLQGALAMFARNLSVIHQEISAPNMQGKSNFKPVIEDIEAILGVTVQNSEDANEMTDTSTTE